MVGEDVMVNVESVVKGSEEVVVTVVDNFESIELVRLENESFSERLDDSI